MGMEDFLRLLTAQIANQDPMEPMKDTEFIAQMASISSVTGKGIQDLLEEIWKRLSLLSTTKETNQDEDAMSPLLHND